MKTMTHLYKHVLTAVLSVCSLLSASAQQATQDALYIYRNDGGFHGFFYADIQKIEFSHIDTLGVEHDDYVVQEITALDSVFRIPISAIDSVAFVTPETKYKEDVVTPSSDLWSYVVESDTLTTFTLSASIPTSMVPKVGDKLALTEAKPYLPHGFYGKVTSLASVPKGYQVVCEGVPLTELFDQYVAKIAVGSNESSNRAARRAEYDASSVELDLPGYERHLVLTTTSWGPNDNFSISGEGQFDFSLKPKVNIRAFLSVSWWDGINFDILCREETTLNYELNLKATVTGQFDISAPPVKIPLGTTPILFEMEAGWASAMSGTVEMYQQWRKVTSGYAAIQYNSIAEGNTMMAISNRELENTWNATTAGTLSMNMGPYVEFNFTLLDKKIARVGTRFESGVKMELSADFKMADLELPMQYQATMLYDKLNRDGSIKTGPYGMGKIIANIGNFSQEVSFYDKYKDNYMAWDFDGGLVPKFEAVGVKYDKANGTATASATLARNILVAGPVGFVIYDKNGKEVDKQWYWRHYWKPETWNKYSIDFSGLTGDDYTVYPIFRLFGKELLAGPAATKTGDEDEQQGLVFKRFKKQNVIHDPNNEYISLHTTYEGEPYEFMSVPLTVPTTDLTNLFETNKHMEVDDQGHFSITADGLTLSGTFANYTAGITPQQGTGTYTISTSYQDNVKTAEQVAAMFRSGVGANMMALMNPMLSGTICHELSGTFTMTWSADDGGYVLTLNKKGTYQFDCICYDGVSNVDIMNPTGAHPNATVTSTKTVHMAGTADVDYQVVYELNMP